MSGRLPSRIVRLTENRFLCYSFILLLLVILPPPLTMGWGKEPVGEGPETSRWYIEEIPVFDARILGLQPVAVDELSGETVLPEVEVKVAPAGHSFAPVTKSGPLYAQPGASARYEITLANYESVTRTVRLSDTLPTQLSYIPGSSRELSYEAATRTLSWEGELAPGHLEYIIEPAAIALPYLDLGALGAPDLCQHFRKDEGACEDVAVSFNLGANGYRFTLYGESLSQITLSSNGLALGAVPVGDEHNQWLPDAAAPGFLLAGLWRDNDLSAAGRWHAAVVTGLIEGHDLFYAQWHDAPSTGNPNATVRHVIALVLDSAGPKGHHPLRGHTFYIYDNVSDPAALLAEGYTIGVEDKPGMRGATFAYAPCCGDGRSPQGHPPAAGTTLHLRPTLLGAYRAFTRIFSYKAVVNALAPETVVNTAFLSSDSPDPALSRSWSSHYLYVRQQTFLPLFLSSGEPGP